MVSDWSFPIEEEWLFDKEKYIISKEVARMYFELKRDDLCGFERIEGVPSLFAEVLTNGYKIGIFRSCM